MQKFKKSFSAHRLLYMLHLGLGIWGRSRCDVAADVSYSRWVRKRMYFDISITHNTLHHRGQSRGQRGEETSFILTPAQLHSINIIETDTQFWRLLLMTLTGKNHSTEKSITGLFYVFGCESSPISRDVRSLVSY